jgi:hypothetical protein
MPNVYTTPMVAWSLLNGLWPLNLTCICGRASTCGCSIEYMPNGYLLEEVAVSSPGARLENEPKWYTFRVKVGEVRSARHVSRSLGVGAVPRGTCGDTLLRHHSLRVECVRILSSCNATRRTRLCMVWCI